MNAFDLEEGSVTADNLSQMKAYLMATHPQQYAQLAPQLKNCSLEAELDTVSGCCLPLTLSFPAAEPRQLLSLTVGKGCRGLVLLLEMGGWGSGSAWHGASLGHYLKEDCRRWGLGSSPK